MIGSDHRPLFLSMGGTGRRKWKCFCFEDKWVAMEGFSAVLNSGWNGCLLEDKQEQVTQQLSRIQKCLNEWARVGATNCRRRIQGYMEQLESSLRSPYDEMTRL